MYTSLDIRDMAEAVFPSFISKVKGNSNMVGILRKQRYTDDAIMKNFPKFCYMGKEFASEHDLRWNLKSLDRKLLFTPQPMLANKLLEDIGAGNCQTLSLAYIYHFVNYLLDKKVDPKSFSIEVIAPKNLLEMDHVFVLLNRKAHQGLENRLLWTHDSIIVDPWLRLIFSANNWEQFMFPCAHVMGWNNPHCPSGFRTVWNNEDKNDLIRVLQKIKTILSEAQQNRLFQDGNRYNLTAEEYIQSLYPVVSQSEKEQCSTQPRFGA